MAQGSPSVPCDMCGQPVMTSDLQARMDPRGFHMVAGDALLCPRCAWIVDHIPKSFGREPTAPPDPRAELGLGPARHGRR